MSILIIIIAAILSLAGVILMARWVYLDAKSRGVNPLPWVLLVLLVSPNFIGLIIYALVRPKNRIGDHCPQCGADIPVDCNYCPNCGAKHEATPNTKVKKGPRLTLLITGVVLLAVALTVLCVFAFRIVASGNTPFGSYTIGSVSNKWGNEWTMSFRTLQGSESADFTAKSDNPRIVYSSQITQGELTIQIYEQNGQSNILRAEIHANEEGVLDDLVKGLRYKVIAVGQQARGSFSFKME